MNWSKSLSLGCIVSYSDVNLWKRKGVLISFEKGPYGGDCRVEWEGNYGLKSEELTSNLISWSEEKE